MVVPVHNELHARMPPPPKPSTEQIVGALCFLGELPDTTLSYPPETVEQLAGHFMEQQNNLAKRFGKHLLGQLKYLEQGYVDLSERVA